MKEGNKSAANIPGRELIIARVLRRTARPRVQSVDRSKARGAVWGPKRFTNPLCEWDARVGGAIRVDMRGPDGNVYPMGGAFREIVPPERLVFTTTAYFDNESNPMLENLNSVTFEEHEGGTRMTLHVVVLKATPEAEKPLAGMKEGWSSSLDKLAELIAKTKKTD